VTPEKTQSPISYPSDLVDEEWEFLQPIFTDQIRRKMEALRKEIALEARWAKMLRGEVHRGSQSGAGSEPFDCAASRRDLLALVGLFLRGETILANLTAAIGPVVEKRRSYFDLAPRDRLFTRARINVDTIPRESPLSSGSRLPADKHLARINLYPGPGSDLKPDWLPRELVY